MKYAHKSRLRNRTRCRSLKRLLIECLESRRVFAGDIELVKDLNTSGLSFNPGAFAEVAGNVYFNGQIGGQFQNTELFKLNPATNSINLVKDINPSGNSQPLGLTNVANTLYFSAIDPSAGRELMRSDGTALGTQVVKDIFPGGHSSPTGLTNVSGKLLFAANDGTNGNELWKSDGTSAGTTMVRDIRPGSASSSISLSNNSLVVDSIVYFTADNGSSGVELWRSDGTPEGTFLLKDIFPGVNSSNPQQLTNVNGTVYFSASASTADFELWKTDGTTTGTQQVMDLNVSTGSNPSSLTNLGGMLFFSANSFGSIGTGSGVRQFKTDGTAAGTTQVELVPSYQNFLISRGTFVGSHYVFAGYTPGNGQELWKTDGTTIGTSLVADLNPGSGNTFFPSVTNPTSPFTTVSGRAYFTAENGSGSGSELWQSDGTAAGTQIVKDINPGAASSDIGYFTRVAGKLYFRATSYSTGVEVWGTDGTPAGTALVQDAVPGNASAISPSFSSGGSQVVFRANGDAGVGLYKTDGTSDGTTIVKAFPNGLLSIASPVQLGSYWYFTATEAASGEELWRTDGTASGTTLVKDIRAGGLGSSITSLTVARERLLFVADDGTTGSELWTSDGTTSGTFRVKDIRAGTISSNPLIFTSLEGGIIFTANDGTNGTELWKSDGTPSGTFMLANIASGSANTTVTAIENVNGIVYFAAADSNGNELWRTDGTTAGTFLFADLNSGPGSSNPSSLQNIGGRLFFQAFDSQTNKQRIWVSNGTPATTTPLPFPSSLTNISAFGFKPRLIADDVTKSDKYFFRNIEANNSQLWATDGTLAGTEMLINVPGQSHLFTVYDSVDAFGTIYLLLTNPIGTTSVLRSQGTAATTQTVTLPTGLQLAFNRFGGLVGSNLLIAGSTTEIGTELYGIALDTKPTNIAISNQSVPENSLVGTVVGSLTTQDLANLTYTYSLATGQGDIHNSKFAVVNNQLVLAATVDYEQLPELQVRLRSTSSNGAFVERAFVVQVQNVNEFPTAHSQTITTAPGASKAIALFASDPEQSALIYTVRQLPRHGTLSGTGASLTYVPNSGFVGADDFYFTVFDGQLTSTEAKVSITVLSVAPTVSFTSSTVTVNESVGVANLRVQLDTAQATAVTVPITLFGGNATTAKDYIGPTSITIPAGSQYADATYTIVDDAIFESTEFSIFDLQPSSQGLYVLGFSRIALQIADNDTQPTVTFAAIPQTVNEGQTVKVDVTLSSESGSAVVIPILSSGLATIASDYGISTGSPANPPTFTIPPGSRTASFFVSILDDTTPEADESFTLSIGTPLNNSAFVGSPSSVTYTIAANDMPVVNFLEPARKVNESQATVVVTAFLQAPAPSAMTVPFTVSGSLALGVDYNIDRSSFVFAAGAQTATATITIIDDSVQELTDEALSLRLSSSAAYAIGRALTYTLTVADNDYSQVSFSTPTINLWEDVGTVVLTVTNSKPSTAALTVPYIVQFGGPAGYGSATRDQDYSIPTNSFVFPPLATSAQVTVTITNDAVNEAPEYFSLKLLPPLGVFSATNQVTVAIRDDDPLATFNQTYVAAVESTVTPSFQVSLSAPSNKSISLPFTLTGTAIAGVDYTRPVPQQVTIPAGQTTGSVAIPLLQDTDSDGFKTLSIDLLSPTNALLAAQNTRAVLTVADDDTAPTLSMSAGADLIDLRVRSSIQETNRTGTVNVSLSSPATRDVTVTIRAEGSAARGLDYVLQGLVNDQLTIPAGATVASFTIRTIEDSAVESEELIMLSLDRPSHATLSSSNYLLVSIQDNDFSFSIPVQPAAPATPTAACVPNASTLSIPTCTQNGASGSVGSYSPTTGTTYVSVDSGPTSPDSLSIPAVVASQGLLNGAVGFMDANFNNVPDFLDLNSNGIQDAGEPDEPVTFTLSDGMTAFAIPPEMDKNLDGVIGTDEAHFVVSGGTDTSTGLLVSGTLSAPMGIYALTPLTTLIDLAVRSGLTVSVATERLQTALEIDNYDLYQGNSLQESLAGNSLAAKAYSLHVQIYTSALLVANFVSGQGNGAFSVDQLVNLTYEDFARYTSSESGTLNLKSAETISATIDAVANRSSLNIDGQLKSSIASVIANSIQVLNSYNFDTFANGKAYLEQLVRAKKVLHGEAAVALRSVGQNSSLLAEFVTNYTGQNLSDKISGAQPLVIAPAVVMISDAIQVEGNSGQTTLQFVVQISGDHPTGVDVSYTTADFTATGLDYIPTNGTLHWDAGDNSPRTINVTVLADSGFETDELIKLQLLPSATVAIRRPTGFGFILNDDALVESMPNVESGVSQIEYSTDTAESYLSTPDQTLFRGPVTNPIQSSFDGRADQSDRLIVNYSNRTYRSDLIQFRGGAGTGNDEFQLIGGSFTSMNFQFGALGTDVTFATNDSSDGVAHTIGARIESTESISLRPADVENITIEFPFATTGIVIEDADSHSLGATRIRSLNNQFAPVTITNPSQRLRVIVHNRATSISSAPDSDLAGRVDIIGSYDDTAPHSLVQGLPANATSTTLTVSLSATDLAGPSGSWISGLNEYDVYVAIDNGPFTRFVTLPVSTTSFNYTASGNHHYFFRSIARDQAGNVEAKSGYDAYTYVGDLLRPVTSIISATYATNGLFTLIASGNDMGGSTLASFDFYVQVDGAAATKVGTVNASPQAPGATATASMSYQAIVDGANHTYHFYSIGRDAVGNVEDAPAAPDQTITGSFTGGLSATGIDVQSGTRQRSFINRVDLLFNSATGLETLLNTNRIAVERFGLSATDVTIGTGTNVPISSHTLNGNKIDLSFGSSGLANDGFYRVRVDTNGDLDTSDPGEAFEFYRLRGDANGDAIVDALDTAVVDSLFGRVGNNLDGDLDGNGVVNSTDRNYTLRTYRGRKLADHLKLWLDD